MCAGEGVGGRSVGGLWLIVRPLFQGCVQCVCVRVCTPLQTCAYINTPEHWRGVIIDLYIACQQAVSVHSESQAS